MPEFVGLNAQAPDAFERLNQLLSMRRGMTALQMEQQTARQRAALAEYPWEQHTGADGTIDVPSLNNPALRAAAGDQYQDVVQNAIATKEAQLGAQRTLLTLRGEQRAEFGAMMNALRSDADVLKDTPAGRQKVTQAMVQYGELHGEDVLPVLRAYAPQLQGAPPGRLNDALRAIGLQAMSAEHQAAAQVPQMLDTGGELVNVNPMAVPTEPIARTVAPQIVRDQAGNEFVLDSATNTLRPVGAGRAAAPGDAPNAPPFTRVPYVGAGADIERFQQEVAEVRAAADTAPTQRATLRKILDLSRETSTGPLAAYLQDTRIGGQLFGDNYQELGKYLERNALQAMVSMGGPPSDARLSAAVAANGSTRFNPEALRAVTEFNYAANSGLEAYRRGLDQAVGLDRPDYTKVARFKADWARNFDIDAFRLENAITDGDDAAQAAILAELTPERRREIAAKLRNLDALSETGSLPRE